jgi:hypothetical protein
MRKILFVLAALLLCLTPALAQRGQQRQPQHQQQQQRWNREPAEHKQAVRDHRDEYRGHRDRDFERRDHRDRFDHEYYGRHFGGDHRFYWQHCRWHGPRFYPGSSFWYGGAWFVIVDPVPDYWGDEYVYIEEIDGFYYVVNPMYPGQRFIVTVIF